MHPKRFIFLILAIFSAFSPLASGASKLEAGAVYLRGGFNGWGSDHAFEGHQDELRLELAIGRGFHEFKLATRDWSQTWAVNSAERAPLTLGKPRPLEPGGEANFLLVEHTQHFRFRILKPDSDSPRLQVELLPTAPPRYPDPHQGHMEQITLGYTDVRGDEVTATISSPDASLALREFVHSTEQKLRDPGPPFVRYRESAKAPQLRSGNLAFDALFALAVSEARDNQVEAIRDSQYRGGDPIACPCFETGAKWHYVWTRDTAYAADLGLGWIDAARARNSLQFKLAPPRPEVEGHMATLGLAGEQIVQDTGTGGSWPVSSDRVTWTFGAARILPMLAAENKKAFAQRAYSALKTTLAADRVALFDKHDGLYQGEQSFLDWRDQSYAPWMLDDIASLASSKALSTNVAHYHALNWAAELATQLDTTEVASRFKQQAKDLKNAINQHFWLPERQLYSSLTHGHFNPRAQDSADWLGTALAVITGVADQERSRLALSHYPHGELGAPVIFPQLPDIPIYHNRGIWPFVTAYGLRAAIAADHSAVADAAYDTLIRGAALSLSNMENFEWRSLEPLWLDNETPALSGPVINSRRQLWSVAGYLAMVVEGVFGLRAETEGLAVQPYITTKLARRFFTPGATLVLKNVPISTGSITVNLELPKSWDEDHQRFHVVKIELDGKSVEARIPWDTLKSSQSITVTLAGIESPALTITQSPADPMAFAPLVSESPKRNSRKSPDCQVARMKGEGAQWDSQDSPPVCVGWQLSLPISVAKILGEPLAAYKDHADFGRILENWGSQKQQLEIADIRIPSDAHYSLQFRYRNRSHLINLGITNGVKRFRLYDANNRLVAQSVVQMPHTRDSANWRLSTPLITPLKQGAYRLKVDDFFNMSYLEANRHYSGAGGTEGPRNRVDLAALEIRELPAPLGESPHANAP